MGGSAPSESTMHYPVTIQNFSMRSFSQKIEILYQLFPGLVSYLLVTGGGGLNPFSFGWLVTANQSNLDSAQNYLGWEFFRRAPLLQWPFGRIPNLGPLDGSSVALTDSLPLFAFIFKPITFWLDRPFQYFGLWILICFILQSFFAWKILALWVEKKSIIGISVLFFTLAPGFLDRMRNHLPLSGHWIILASIFLVLSDKAKFGWWLLLGGIATLTQPYFLPIVVVLFISKSLAEVFKGNTKPRTLMGRLGLLLILATFAGFQAGLLAFGLGQISGDGFGEYSTSILSVLDPIVRVPFSQDLFWSNIVPSLAKSQYQYEGFSYLGTGCVGIAIFALLVRTIKSRKNLLQASIILILFVFCVITNLVEPTLTNILFLSLGLVVYESVFWNTKRPLLRSVFFGSSLLAVFSFVTAVEFGSSKYQNYLETRIIDLAQIFRSSGRFIWVLMYVLIIAVVLTISRHMKFERLLAFVLLAAIIFQVQDSRAATAATRARFKTVEHENVLTSPLWREVANRYSKIVIVDPSGRPKLESTHTDFFEFIHPDIWLDLGLFAAENDLAMNDFYFSRFPETKDSAKEITKILIAGDFDKETLYVFTDAPKWILAKINQRGQDLIGLLDGLPVLLPGLGECIACDLTGFQSKV